MGRVEILAGVERRSVWSDEDKASESLDEVETSGSSVAEIALPARYSSAADSHLAQKLGGDIGRRVDQA